MTPEQYVLSRLGVQWSETCALLSDLDPEHFDEPVYAKVAVLFEFPVETALWTLRGLSPAVDRILDVELRWLTPEAVYSAVHFISMLLGPGALAPALRAVAPPSEIAAKLMEYVRCL